MGELFRYVQVKSLGSGGFYVDVFENVHIEDILEGAEAGEEHGYLVSIVEMTRDEFDNLPEFTGF